MIICNLCKKEEAKQAKSHIIPKFLAKGLFEGNTPRYSLQIKKGKRRRVQDTPKEDFILCPSCEERIALLENYFSRKIVAVHDFNNRPKDFKIIEEGPNLTLECRKINPTAFKLFFYSIFWRISISKLRHYDNFKLPSQIENEFGSFINTHLKSKHGDMMESFQTAVEVPNYHLVVFKPFVKNELSRGVFMSFQASEFLYVIFTPDLAAYLYTDDESIDFEMKHFSNYQNHSTLISLSSLEQWKRVNQNVIDKILPKSN